MEHYTQSRISKQAIDKRFNERTKNMLYLILQQVMSKQVACKHSLFKSKSMFTDIRIMDSSSTRGLCPHKPQKARQQSLSLLKKAIPLSYFQ